MNKTTKEITNEIAEEIGLNLDTYKKVIKSLQCLEINSNSSECKQYISSIRRELQSMGKFESNKNLF